ELPRLRDAVLERLLEERRVVVLQELDLDAGLLLEQRDDLVLERHEAAVLERADHDLALRGARGRCGAVGRGARGLLEQRSGGDGGADRRGDELLAGEVPLVSGGHRTLLSLVCKSPWGVAFGGH